MNLAEIKEGESAILTEIGGAGALRQHFLDMGLIPGTRVTARSSRILPRRNHPVQSIRDLVRWESTM